MALFISKTQGTKANLINNIQIRNLSFFHFFPFNYSAKFFNLNILQKLKEININKVGLLSTT